MSAPVSAALKLAAVIRTCNVEIGLSLRRRTDAIRSAAFVPAAVVFVNTRDQQRAVSHHLTSDLSHACAHTQSRQSKTELSCCVGHSFASGLHIKRKVYRSQYGL